MNILITGAAGFLGGRLSKALAAQGHTITATSRRDHRAAEFAAQGIYFQTGDLTDPAFCQSIVQGQEAVVHCAALSSPWGKYADFFKANMEATRLLCDAALQADVQRFINIGTPSIYANYQDRLGITEDTPLPKQMVNHYASTKLLAETYVLTQHSPDFQTVSLRPRAIIGAEDRVIFPRIIRAYESGRLRIIGNPEVQASLTSVPNIAHAVEQALTAPAESMGRAYNLADPEPVKLWEEINFVITSLGKPAITKQLPYGVAMFAASLAETKARWLGGGEPTLTRYGISVLAKHCTLDIRQARQYLGYDPQKSSREGLKEFLEWYKDNDQ